MEVSAIFLAKGAKPGDYSQTDEQECPGCTTRDAAQLSLENFLSGLYCAESVLKAVADIHGCSNPIIPGIATGFCGGVSRTSGMCGALAGGIMALGLLTGRSKPSDPKEQCYALVHCLVNRFREQFGSTQCTDLLGCDISTPDGARQFKADNLEETVCERVTSQTAGLVQDIYQQRETIRHPLL
jgi:C_GCAxxG_C_C family probable redox protein